MKKGSKHSIEARMKMSASGKGRPKSPETRAKISAALSGENSPNFGKHLSAETRAKISANLPDNSGPRHPNFGKKASADTRAKLSASRRGEKNHMFGKTHTAEARAKISKAMSGENHPYYGKFGSEHPSFGKRLSEEVRSKRSEATRGEKNPMYGKRFSQDSRKKMSENHADVSGEKNPRWEGGISFEPYCPKFNREFKERVRAFFEYSCVICGKTEGEEYGKLSVHHVDYDKKVCCNERPPMFAAVCRRHNAIANRDRERWQCIFHRIIDEIYGGKSYFTKEEYHMA